MNTGFQRKIHYLALGILFLGGLGLLEGKWYDITAGVILCLISSMIMVLLLPSLLHAKNTSRWNKKAFLAEFILLLALGLIHVLPGHIMLSISLGLIAMLPAAAWIKSK